MHAPSEPEGKRTLSRTTPSDAAQIEELRPAAVELGRRWARTLVAALRADGRRAAGGWPGTLSEARSRADALLGSARFAARNDACEAVARFLYAAARSDWLAHRDAEVAEGADGSSARSRRTAH